MGTLFYGAGRLRVEIDDALLQALEVISFAKIRRSEPFLLTWNDSTKIGNGRSTIMITPTSELHFKYLGSRVPTPDRELLEQWAQAANSNGGIRLDSATLAVPA